MFTTPFDTIKTRLQTRGVTGVDGGRRAGVLPTMRDIVAKEGVGGLYRGVTPRLFIYITQGAVFFTAYEITRMALLGYVSARRGRWLGRCRDEGAASMIVLYSITFEVLFYIWSSAVALRTLPGTSPISNAEAW